MNKVIPHKLNSFDFWKCYFIQMRPYLLFVSGIAGLMGTTLPSIEINYARFILSFVAFFLGYGFGQALTDSFQTDTDTISSPYRPLSKGLITENQVRYVSLVGLLSIATIIVGLSWSTLILCILSIAGLASYSVVKRYWPLGPFHNSWIVMLMPAMGFLSIGGMYDFNALHIKSHFPYLITFFSYCNFVLIGYLKDIDADRETKYNTFPVVFGWYPTLWLGNINLVIFLILSFFLIDEYVSITGAIFLLTILIGVYGQIKGFLAKDFSPSSATIPIANTVRAFILIHIMIMIENKPELLVFCIIYYLLFELFLYKRPEQSQI